MLRTSFFAVAVFFALALPAGNAYAQATRTWISGVGDDVNPCSRTAPCKTFAGAISKTAAGGEIDVLDPGGFGTVTITKSITLDGGAGLGSILASGTNGINVNAGGNDVIVIRNLSINGAGSTLGVNGISFLAGGALHIEDSVISNFSQAGVSAVSATGNAAVYIKKTTIRTCATALLVSAINVGATGTLAASIWNSSLANSPVGINVGALSTGSAAAVNLALYNTILSGHSTAAIRAVGAPTVTLERGVIANSAIAVDARGGNVQLSGVMLSNNTSGLASSGGNVTSFGNNALTAGNHTDGSVTVTLPLQ